MTYAYSSPNLPVTLHPFQFKGTRLDGGTLQYRRHSGLRNPVVYPMPSYCTGTVHPDSYSNLRGLTTMKLLGTWVFFGFYLLPLLRDVHRTYWRDQGHTNFTKIQEPSLHSRRQHDDTNQVPYPEPKKGNILWHCKKFIRHGDWRQGICTPLDMILVSSAKIANCFSLKMKALKHLDTSGAAYPTPRHKSEHYILQSLSKTAILYILIET